MTRKQNTQTSSRCAEILPRTIDHGADDDGLPTTRSVLTGATYSVLFDAGASYVMNIKTEEDTWLLTMSCHCRIMYLIIDNYLEAHVYLILYDLNCKSLIKEVISCS